MAWPFGYPLMRGRSANAKNNVLRTPMEQGEDRRQQVSREKLLVVNVQFHLKTETDLAAFWVFYDSPECKQGAAFFDMDLRIAGPIATHQVRMGQPNVVPDGLGWLVSCSFGD